MFPERGKQTNSLERALEHMLLGNGGFPWDLSLSYHSKSRPGLPEAHPALQAPSGPSGTRQGPLKPLPMMLWVAAKGQG